MAYQNIVLDQTDGVVTITLTRPERLNAVTPAMVDEITEAFGRVESDRDVKAVIVTGEGRGFCSGADLARDRNAPETSAWAGSLGPIGGFGRVILAVSQCTRPVIAAVNGPCIGAGLGLACACDIRLASDRATFSGIFARRGLTPDSGTTYFLPRLVGTDHAVRLLATGEIIDAPQALAIGLVTDVVPHEELMLKAAGLASTVARGASVAINNAKRAVYMGLKNDLAGQLELEAHLAAQCFQTEDFQEGVRAFLEKREPQFKGR